MTPVKDIKSLPKGKAAIRTWLRMLTSAQLIEKSLRAQLRIDYSSTLPRFDVMATLDHFDRPMTMGELSSQLMVSDGNVTHVVNRLKEDGLIKRKIKKGDKRTFFVSLSDKGKEEFSKQAIVHEQWIEDLFSSLGEDDMNTLWTILGSLREGLLGRNDNSKSGDKS
jgi:DNA-binding MarR family transcriptional regulator